MNKLVMELSSFLKKHPSLLYAEEFQNVCSPLFKLGIDFFSHLRINGKNTLTANGSNPDYFRLYFEQEFQHFDIHSAEFTIPQRYILWDQIDKYGKAEELHRIEKEFGIDHVFTIVEQSQDEKNYYSFAVHPHKEYRNDFYFGRLELLEQFVLYYKHSLTLNDRINRAYTLSCPFEASPQSYIIKDNLSSLSSLTIRDYLDSIQLPDDCYPSVQKLPPRELQCALYLLEGRSSIEIGTLLHLSPRTVETYINRLRKRFGSKNKIQLVKHLIESGLHY